MARTPNVQFETATDCAGEMNGVFLKNMSALWRTDARLAQGIDDLPQEIGAEVVASKAGPMTARVATEEGRQIYLHSRYDPMQEAERFAEAAGIESKSCLLVAGFGLGYHVNAMFARMHDEAVMVVAEPSLEMLKTALEHVDLAGVLGSGRCFVLCEVDKGRIDERMRPFGARTLLDTQYVVHGPSEQAASSFHQTMRAALTDYLAYSKLSLQTLVQNARITNTNVAYNLVTYVTTPPISVVRERFAGYPAIVVAAGPSLVRNIGRLADAQGRAMIIAVQTTFKTLLSCGIAPDFVTSLDYAEISRRFFEDVEDFRGVHLIAEAKANWATIDAYGGPLSLLDNEFARLCLGEGLAARDGLKAGSTVAHLAFYLAEYLGCDPVALVGQDLAFSHGVFYAPGMEIHNSWRPELNRFYSIESKEWERVVRHREHLRKSKDIDGNDVYADEQLFTYLQQFESDFASSRVMVVDATEGGVPKSSTTRMSLAEFLERHCRRAIPRERFTYRERTRWRDDSRLQVARRELAARMTELEAMVDVCRRMQGVLSELKGLVDRPAEFNRRMARVDELRAQMREYDRIYRMVTSVSQQAELRRFAAEHKLSVARSEGRERVLRQLDRDNEFVAGVLEGAEELGRILMGAAARMDRAPDSVH